MDTIIHSYVLPVVYTIAFAVAIAVIRQIGNYFRSKTKSEAVLNVINTSQQIAENAVHSVEQGYVKPTKAVETLYSKPGAISATEQNFTLMRAVDKYKRDWLSAYGEMPMKTDAEIIAEVEGAISRIKQGN